MVAMDNTELRQVRALVPAEVAQALYAQADAEGITLQEFSGRVLAGHVAASNKPVRKRAPRKTARTRKAPG